MILVQGKEMISLYLLLKDIESPLDALLQNLLDRIERQLYEQLSIQEIENLDELYRKDEIFLE